MERVIFNARSLIWSQTKNKEMPKCLFPAVNQMRIPETSFNVTFKPHINTVFNIAFSSKHCEWFGHVVGTGVVVTFTTACLSWKQSFFLHEALVKSRIISINPKTTRTGCCRRRSTVVCESLVRSVQWMSPVFCTCNSSLTNVWSQLVWSQTVTDGNRTITGLHVSFFCLTNCPKHKHSSLPVCLKSDTNQDTQRVVSAACSPTSVLGRRHEHRHQQQQGRRRKTAHSPTLGRRRWRGEQKEFETSEAEAWSRDASAAGVRLEELQRCFLSLRVETLHFLCISEKRKFTQHHYDAHDSIT